MFKLTWSSRFKEDCVNCATSFNWGFTKQLLSNPRLEDSCPNTFASKDSFGLLGSFNFEFLENASTGSHSWLLSASRMCGGRCLRSLPCKFHGVNFRGAVLLDIISSFMKNFDLSAERLGMYCYIAQCCFCLKIADGFSLKSCQFSSGMVQNMS